MPTADRPAPYYPCRDEVIRVAREVDPVEVVRAALLLHAQGRTTLPAEAHLPWTTSDGQPARSLALPAALWGDAPALGLKVINSSLANHDRGLRRAQGLTVLFDRETAYPVAIMEAAYLSALRTAAYTVLSVRLLARQAPALIAVVGCGVIGKTHVRMLAAALPGARFVVYDLDGTRQEALAASLLGDGIDCATACAAEEAIRGAEVVVTATTTTAGYLPHSGFQPGTLVAHVSLDDVLPDVVRLADLVIVDDWPLVRGRSSADQIILSNPFGMVILDVAMAAEVFRASGRLGIGTLLLT
jgi:N-[(2S)-2-amino-2-carboxyethyl]-L-glutamate dehydrogenase